MSCESLRNGLDLICKTTSRRLWQQVVFVNKGDVLEYLIQKPITTINDEYICRYRIAFRLKENTKGYKIIGNEKLSVLSANFSKDEREGFPEYEHRLRVPIMGNDEAVRCFLTQLDNSNYFCAVKYYDNTVEILGFENGLTTADYEYNPSTSSGINVISIISNAPEDDMPYIYYNATGTESDDFDNDFQNVPEFMNGDFNDDFNDDFYNNQI